MTSIPSLKKQLKENYELGNKTVIAWFIVIFDIYTTTWEISAIWLAQSSGISA